MVKTVKGTPVCWKFTESSLPIIHILCLKKDKNIHLLVSSSCSPNTSSILLKLVTRQYESVANVLRSLLPSNVALSWRKCQKCKNDVCRDGCFPRKDRYPRWTLHAPAAENIARERAASTQKLRNGQRGHQIKGTTCYAVLHNQTSPSDKSSTKCTLPKKLGETRNVTHEMYSRRGNSCIMGIFGIQ